MVLTAVGLIRVMVVVGLGPVLGVAGLDPVLGLDLDRVLDQDLGLVRDLVPDPTMVPITGRALDRRAARLALLHLLVIRLSSLGSRLRPLAIFLPSKSKNISRRGPQNCRSLGFARDDKGEGGLQSRSASSGMTKGRAGSG